ncbi:hypothetical protein NKR23_g6237 [Pleurostoma richardsiae]|uniref:EthD domain-containing protein n=1 Tax=Pleurostoma richardsiae TaxID=41990 RepID=A0AA38RQT6_9PEZI|nr:hypothetical protein NKR23_g6237 [Pleurostoma richardsiae]
MSAHLTILIKKLDHLSHEEFHNYWSKSHPSTFLSVGIVRSNVKKYVQFHINQNVSASLAEAGLPVSEWDGGVEMWAEDLGDLMAVFQDEEYNRVVVPDEQRFLKRSEAKMMVGWDEVKWEGLEAKNKLEDKAR